MEIVAVDIGGTNARFCRARLHAGAAPHMGTIRKYKVTDYETPGDAWRRFMRDEAEDGDAAQPLCAVMAIAAPITDGSIPLTNSHWVVDRQHLQQECGLDHLLCINDFEAMAYGVMALSADELTHVFGPDNGLPVEGAVTIIGPGTGLGVGLASRAKTGLRILPTEGGHIAFAPADEEDARILAYLARHFGRVSAERIISGPGLGYIRDALIAGEGHDDISPDNSPDAMDDAALWAAALKGTDSLAVDALAHLCRSYGAVAGDLALAHGAAAVVLAGGLTGRMLDHGALSGFYAPFLEKGRHRRIMEKLPVYHADHPEAGLFGAAAAGAVHFL